MTARVAPVAPRGSEALEAIASGEAADASSNAAVADPDRQHRDRLDAVVARQEQALGRQASALSSWTIGGRRHRHRAAARFGEGASAVGPATGWSSHKDIAAKALRKLAGPHVPASLTKLEQAVKRANAAYEKAEAQVREQQRAERQATVPETDEGIGDEFDEDLDDAA